MTGTLGKRSRGAGGVFVGGVWKGNPEPPGDVDIDGADGGGGGAAPRGALKGVPMTGTLGKRSRGGGGAFVSGVWKGNPEPLSGAGAIGNGTDGGGGAFAERLGGALGGAMGTA
jgi:hypothetical protein